MNLIKEMTHTVITQVLINIDHFYLVKKLNFQEYIFSFTECTIKNCFLRLRQRKLRGRQNHLEAESYNSTVGKLREA
jgi:hypothetical protein